MTSVYILKLENDKYYIGKTNDIKKRLKEHISQKASNWTTKHKIISVEKIIENVDSFDEDKYVKEYMSKYGIDNVRGGSYTTEKLDYEQKKLLQKEIKSAKDMCFRCGKTGHFANDCYVKKNKYIKKYSNNREDFNDEECSTSEFDNEECSTSEFDNKECSNSEFDDEECSNSEFDDEDF